MLVKQKIKISSWFW